MVTFWNILLLCATIVTASNGAEIKNVLLLLADDAGFEMGAYLNKYCQTPNLDMLARKGLLFNNAFSSVSSGSPSRAQLLTGQPSHSNGMYGTHQGINNFNVLPDTPTLPNVLREKLKGQLLSGIIGKKDVGSAEHFKFDYEQTEEQHDINQIGRNISNIKLYTREFLQKAQNEKKSFFLMIGFHDPHRCGHITPQYGEFCERWGSGEIDMGTIPDWRPIYYDWTNLAVPAYLPNTDIVKQELAAQYMTMSRLDQGIGLVLRELQNFGFDDNTLVIFTSDNGPSYPAAKTNLYEHGIRSPFMLTSPNSEDRHLQTTGSMSSLLDVYPTILDAFNLYAKEVNSSQRAYAKSLLPLLKEEPQPNEEDAVFGSQNFDDVTMSYPMRMIRTRRYKLIHNINYWSYFPIAKDFFVSPTFQQILNATINRQNLPWYRTLSTYYQRPEWEMYDIKMDVLERYNLADKPKYKDNFKALKQRLFSWLEETNDPWRCAPHAVLQNEGVYKTDPVCLSLAHDNLKMHLSLRKSKKYVLI